MTQTKRSKLNCWRLNTSFRER